MHDTTSWRKNLVQRLRPHWSEENILDRGNFCNIELGLYLVSQLTPDAPVRTLWVLLTGYPFSTSVTKQWGAVQYQMLGNARRILPYFRSDFQWKRALSRYRQVEEQLRMYDVDAGFESFRPKPVSIAANRIEAYQAALTQPLPYRWDTLQWATEGSYFFEGQKYRSHVNIPKELVFSELEKHELDGQQKREPLCVTWKELVKTAQWMDKQLQVSWYTQRLQSIRLEWFDEAGTLSCPKNFTLNGLTNLVGMVSSGKSTLMKILTVWAARKGLRITLVVGDVIGALNLAKLFDQLKLSVAPILGQSNRKRHINRLHKVLATEQAQLSSLEHRHVGFQWLSSACPLDGLRNDTGQPLLVKDYPCRKLQSPSDEKPLEYACPMYAVCPFHQAQRDLVRASIRIATPASLVYTRIAQQINEERVRFLELVYRCSDLVIVDEADQVQVQLDMMFSPNQTLVSLREGWLDSLSQRVVTELNLGGRGQLRNESVDNWHQANETAQVATNKIYGLLLRDTHLSRKVERGYFTDWSLFNDIANSLIKDREEKQEKRAEEVNLPKIFEQFIVDPLGERNPDPIADELRRLSQQCITMTTAERVQEQIVTWIKGWNEYSMSLSDEQLSKIAIYFEFALLVTVLQDRLNFLIREWKHVEEPLKLEGGSSMMFNRPPKDYEGIIPVSPMGNILAFQYIRPEKDAPGDLRFFRCMGVGRCLLLHWHELFAADQVAGPHVMLLSGSSWAGTSPGYHIQAPVKGILRAPEQEIDAIRKSVFEFTPFYDTEGRPISVSGKYGQRRIAALENILSQLSQKSAFGDGLSQLEFERRELPPNRQRILLLVGSYEEARQAREYLEEKRPDWQDQVLNLVADDEGFESEWRGNENRLQRGLVHSFADTGAWVLIAPLLAVERGHNILNEEDRAAIGAAYFLIRPHPRPDDISFAIQSINRWAVERSADTSLLKNASEENLDTLLGVGKTFRNEAYSRWRYLLYLPMIYSTVKDEEREAITWNQLVSIWQVIGRLIRGGSEARIYFCDAAFALKTASPDEVSERPQKSLLVGLKQVLQPYFCADSAATSREQILVQALYGPLYHALKNMRGVIDE